MLIYLYAILSINNSTNINGDCIMGKRGPKLGFTDVPVQTKTVKTMEKLKMRM
jgi:nitrogen fixation protein